LILKPQKEEKMKKHVCLKKKLMTVFLAGVLTAGSVMPVYASSVVKKNAYSAAAALPADALAVFETAEAKNAALDSCSVTFTMQTQSTLQNGTGSQTGFGPVSVSGEMKAKNAGAENLAFILHETIRAGNSSMEINSFYENGCSYMNMPNTENGTADAKYRLLIPVNEAIMLLKPTLDPGSADISAITDMTMEKSGEDTVIRYHANPALLANFQSALLDDPITGAGIAYKAGGSLSSFAAEVTINPEGYYTNKKISWTVSGTEGNLSYVRKTDMDIIILEAGVPVDFELPSTDGYDAVFQMK